MLSDWKYPVGAAIGAAFMLASCLLWYEGIPWLADGRVDVVRREAAAGMVHIAELNAANGRNAELRRQVEAGRANSERYAAQLAIAQAAEAEAMELLEQKDRDYEAKLEAAGRSCRLDADDLRFLRQP